MTKRLALLFALLATVAHAQQPRVPISALPPAVTPLVGTETVPVVQNGQTRRAFVSDLFGSTSVTTFGRTATVNTWALTQTFSVPPQFPSLAGYMKANSGTGVTASPTVPTTDLAGVLQGAQFAGAAIGGAAITGSTVDGTPIGGTTPAAGSFTTAGATTAAFGSLSVTNAPVFTALSGILRGNGAGAVTALGSTGTGNVVLANSPALVTPALGTPASGVLTNATGLPISTGVAGLGTGVAAGLGSAATGTGGPVLSSGPTIASPTLTTPALGTPASGNLSNTTGFPAANLGGTTLPAAVVNSSLKTLGTVTTGTWNGARIDFPYQVQAPAGTLRGNLTGATADVADSTLAAVNDAAFGSTRGAIPYRGAAAFTGLAPGTSGYVLTSNGPGADPSYQPAGAATGAPRSSVRQTAQGGPQSAGTPNFLPASSASLTLTAQNVSTGAGALTIAAAQGFNATGPNDVVYQFTSNPSWALPASATSYLFVNTATGATSTQTLLPLYQFGGTISTANGQFTFDYQAMIGYLGNGTTAVVTPLVCVGEAVASASAVTSTIAYAYNGSAEIGPVAMPSANTTYAFNLGIVPGVVATSLINVTANLNYAVGDVVLNPGVGSTGYTATNFALGRNSSTYIFSPFYLANKSTGVVASYTAANWNLKVRVSRGWGGA